jgi:hypothetical protein
MISSRRPNLARNRKNIVETALCSAPYAECFCVSQYGSKAVPTTVTDATDVLDEILNNETELPILEHTTDISSKNLRFMHYVP